MDRKDKIQCHFISNTHWDREWRFSAQRTRYMLVYLMDMLLDIFEKEPEFRSFHLDSQTMPLQDYLEARPEREPLVRKYIEEGRLHVGPWFCLPDEFCVGGEALVRNLLLGHRMARRFGAVSKTGYSPFSWGQISQMPQIYRGFGIDFIAFYRGINSRQSKLSEYWWEGPDGSRILASRLAARPRYNAWYVIQRPAFFNLEDENAREMSWGKDGRAPFRFVDAEYAGLDYQFVHPEFEYHDETVPERAQQAIREQDGQWSTRHRLWSLGHDSSCPDIREVRMIRDSDEALGETADVFHSDFASFQQALLDESDPDWPVLTGEMRYPFTKGSASVLFGWIISARTYIKQDNFITERAILDYAEPLATAASLLGAPYPRNFINLALNWLLQNHGHDSIGGCSRDVVHDDMLYRSRQAREICACVTERAMMDVAGAVDLSAFDPEDMALVVWNPSPFQRSDVMTAYLDVPLEWNCSTVRITDENDREVCWQEIAREEPFYQAVQNPNDCANMYPASRYEMRAQFANVPAFGYRTFRVRPVREKKFSNPATMLTGPQTMENEYLSATVNANGTVDVFHRQSGRHCRQLGYFRDCSEIGNPWQHITVMNDEQLTTLNEKARISLVRDGALETAFRIVIDWELPEGRSEDEKSRSEHLVCCRIVNTVILRRGQPWLEFITEVDNCAEDHYLQVSFPTGVDTDTVAAQGQFDVLERPIPRPDFSQFDEEFQTESPMNSFVDVSDGDSGAAILNEGLKAYEAHDDPDNTLSLTLLRAYPLRICVTQEMTDYSASDKGSQCLGKQTFRYGFMPHGGDWRGGRIWQAAESFTLSFKAAQIGVTDRGSQPLTRSFIEISDDSLHVSAVKKSENGEGWVVRLFNPADETVNAKLRLNRGFAPPAPGESPVDRLRNAFELPGDTSRRWSLARLVSLEEIPEQELSLGPEGWVVFDISRKQILTVEFI